MTENKYQGMSKSQYTIMVLGEMVERLKKQKQQISFEEFEDIIMDYIHANVFPAGDELDYHRKFRENLKEVYNNVIK